MRRYRGDVMGVGALFLLEEKLSAVSKTLEISNGLSSAISTPRRLAVYFCNLIEKGSPNSVIDTGV